MVYDDLKHALTQLIRQVPEHDCSPKSAATALIFTADSLEVLLMERATDPRDPWSGQMALPGGRRDPEDLDLLATAQRETLEEVGITLEREECAGFLPQLQALPRIKGEELMIQPIVFLLSAKRKLSLNHEVASATWVSCQLLRGTQCRSTIEINRGGQTFSLPCWNIGSKKVWGLTERMLTGFIDLMSHGGNSLLEDLSGSHPLP